MLGRDMGTGTVFGRRRCK